MMRPGKKPYVSMEREGNSMSDKHRVEIENGWPKHWPKELCYFNCFEHMLMCGDSIKPCLWHVVGHHTLSRCERCPTWKDCVYGGRVHEGMNVERPDAIIGNGWFYEMPCRESQGDE